MTKVVDKDGIQNQEEVHKEDKWCDLPSLLLWMIKDRLDFPNNLRVAAVCKSWKYASSTYTKDYKSSKDHPPWILITSDSELDRCEFISMSTGEKYTIHILDFCGARTLSSKQGWLLLAPKMRRSTRLEDDSSINLFSDSPIFLLNPFTRMKLELPSKVAAEGSGPFAEKAIRCGAFTVVEGRPDLVVITTTAFKDAGACSTVYAWTARPGDNEWTMHSYTRFQPCRSFFGIVCVLILGQLVYCFNDKSEAIVLNLSNSRWTDLMEYVDWIIPGEVTSYIIESEGEIYNCHVHNEVEIEEVTYMFYKLNTGCMAWEPLEDKDLKDKCWFLKSRFCCNFVFEFKEKWIDEGCRILEENGYSSSVNDLIPDDPEASAMGKEFLLDLTENVHVEWVDMGC